MKIGLDFDGVIADSHSMKPVIAEMMFQVSFPQGLSKDEVIRSYLTHREYEDVKRALYHGLVRIPQVKHAAFYIRSIVEEGHNIKIVTSRSGDTLTPALMLINDWNLSDIEVIGVGYGKSKREACAGLDLFIDDDIDKLTPLSGVVKHLLLFTQPDNKEVVIPETICRMDSWYDVYNHIRYEI